MKVFELAKELNIPPLQLMDQIRQWGLPVKNHMVDLTPELVQEIKKRLGLSQEESPKSSKSSKKGSSSRKKKPDDSGAEAESPAKAAIKVIRRSKAALSEASESKIMEEGPEPMGGSSPEPVIPASQVSAAQKASSSSGSVRGLSAESGDSISSPVAPESSVTEVPKGGSVGGTISEKPSPSSVTSPTGGPQIAASTPVTDSSVSSQASAGVRGGFSLQAQILGRIDLSQVSSSSGNSKTLKPKTVVQTGRGEASSRPASGPGGRGPRLPMVGVGRPKSNLRAGFVSAQALIQKAQQELEADQERKREERRREKSQKEGVAGGFIREGEELTRFDASDFKKREMVFQPKKKNLVLNRPALKTQITVAAAHKRVVKMAGSMTPQSVAQEMGVKVTQLLQALIRNGVQASANSDVDYETWSLILPELGWEARNVELKPEELLEKYAFGQLEAEPRPRPPVVTIMGHVDHGKTTLLDYIRHTNVAAQEAGGITQHIGAYQVVLEDGFKITFLDTPGHEAFSQMRARGAQVTDIVVIVVAADDGIMPQTVEAIRHAQAAQVPIIVAVNKIDKPQANPDRVLQQMTEYGLVPEAWGGDTMVARVSALTGEGVPDLLEKIRLLAEILELKANPDRSAMGVVLEAQLEKGKGPIATLLVREGTLKTGQWIVAGIQRGRVRALFNDRGQRVDAAYPGDPVQILGLEGVPVPGDRFDVVKEERLLDEVVELRVRIQKAQQEKSQVSLENLFDKWQSDEIKELKVVLKADTHGSLEAIKGSLIRLSNNEVKVRVIHDAVGGVTESDVLLAAASQAIILGFNVRPDGAANQKAKSHKVDIRTYQIIYDLIEDVKKALSGLLKPVEVENVLGHAEVRQVFHLSKVGVVAGCFVKDGRLVRQAGVRLIRDGRIVWEGRLSSLKRFKEDVREVAEGFECGAQLEGYQDIKVGDIIECFEKQLRERQWEGEVTSATSGAGENSQRVNV